MQYIVIPVSESTYNHQRWCPARAMVFAPAKETGIWENVSHPVALYGKLQIGTVAGQMCITASPAHVILEPYLDSLPSFQEIVDSVASAYLPH